MRRINSKRELADFLIERRELAISPETVDLIDTIGRYYLPKASDRDDTPEEVEKIFYGKMRGLYSEFCFRVVKGAPDFTAAEAKALKEIINFLRKMIEAHNKERMIYEDSYAIDMRVMAAWRIILSPDFWNSLPVFYRSKVYLRQLRPYMLNIIDHMREQMKNSNVAKEMKKAKDQAEFLNLIKIGGL